MIRKVCTFPIAIVSFLISLNASAGEIKMDISVDRHHIYLGEFVNLTVKVSGTRSPSEPDLSAIRDAKVDFLGSQEQNYASVTIINHRVRRKSFVGRIFTYQVKPMAAGAFTVGPISLYLAGKVISQSGPTIDVAGLEEQDDVLISVGASRESVLVDEPFEITLSIAIKRLKGRYAGADPLDPGEPATIQVPFLDDKPIDGLKTPDIGKLLREHLVSRRNHPGFAINQYTLRNDPFGFGSMFDFDDLTRARKAKFMFDKRQVEKNGQAYVEYSLKLVYVPKEEGSYTFGPVEYKGKTVVDVDAGGHIIGKHIFTIGPATIVRVVPPPEAGRPPSFIGAIGSNLVVDASLDTQTCNIGDPLTLTLKISGDISMENIYPPSLSKQTDLTRDFRIYEDTVQTVTKDGSKEYTYTIRPTKAGTLELPPINVSYYDAGDRQYKIVNTKPIPVRANEAVEIAEISIIDTVTNRLTLSAQPDEDNFIPAPVTMDLTGAEPKRLSPNRWHLIVIVLGPFSCFLSLMIQYARNVTARRTATGRRRQAIERARRRLTETDLQVSQQPDTVPRAVFDTFRGYLADSFNIQEAGLTPSDARRLLQEHVQDQEVTEQFCTILERHFNAGYVGDGGEDRDLSKDIKRARVVLEKMELLIR